MASKIYGTGNETIKGEFNISYYVLEKDKKFLDWLNKLLKDVFEFNRPSEAKYLFVSGDKDNGEELYLKDVMKMKDVHEKYTNKNSRIDIFYGEKRIYLTCRTSRELREKLGSFIEKSKEWIKIKEDTAKVPAYAKLKS